jgi:hypothetical protein
MPRGVRTPLFSRILGIWEGWIRLLVRIVTDQSLSGDGVRLSASPNGAVPHALCYGGQEFPIRPEPSVDPTQVAVGPSLASTVPVCHISPELRRALRLPPRLSLHCRSEGDHWILGPCLAVYTRAGRGRALFDSQTQLFADLVKLGAEHGVDVVVLTPGYGDTELGWRYDANRREWWRERLPMPDVVLRRSAAFTGKDAGKASADLALFESLGRLHTLSTIHGDKWYVYQELIQCSALRSLLPETYYASSPAELFQAACSLRDVYVKPPGRARGASVYHLVNRGNEWEVTYQSLRNADGRTRLAVLRRRLTGPSEFHRFWQSQKLNPCIVQQTIPLARLASGQPFDFRWLVQFNPEPTVVARIARIGGVHTVTTNLHTGGRPVLAEELLTELGWSDQVSLLTRCDDAALAIARWLQERFGPFAELGIDLAISDAHEVYLLEVNPTPGRRMLRLVGGDAREISLRNLLEYAISAAGFGRES